MVFGEFRYPMRLLAVDLLGLPEILEVLVVCPDFEVFAH